MSGKWYGAGANRMWHHDRQHDGAEVAEVRRVLAVFRAEHGWQPGMVWDPYTGAYKQPARTRRAG